MTVLRTVLDNSVTFSLLFAGVWLVKTSLRKHLSARLHYMIWAAVLVSLLIPIRIESGVSLWNLLPRQTAESIIQQTKNLQPINETVNGSNAGGTVGIQPHNQPAATNSAPADPPAISGYSEPARTDPLNPAVRIDWLAALWALWLAGIAASILWLFLGGLKLRRHIVRCGFSETPLWLEVCAEECRKELHLRRHVRIVLQPVLPMPAVMGIFHPILAMPESVVKERRRERVRHILMHEFSHVKRGDLIVLALLNLLSAVYWFNPLIWLCFSRIRADMESSCDNDVVNALGKSQRQEYIRTLVHFSGMGRRARTQAALSLHDARIKMKKRIGAMFMTQNTKPAIAVPVILLILILMLAASATGCLPIDNGNAALASPSATSSLGPDSPAAIPVNATESAVAKSPSVEPQTTSESSPSPSATPAVTSQAPAKTAGTSPLSAYQSVLQNKAGFYSTDAHKNLNINQLNQAVGNDSSVTAKATKLAIVDLENDGTPEVILWLAVNNDDYYGFEVLRYQGGAVYGYTLWYRAFMDIKADGTFSFSSGAADNGFGTVKFTENAYSVDKISYCESGYDSNNNLSVSYFVDHKSATKDDFLSAINKQSEKTAATWYDFTDDNIETVLSDFK